MKNVMLIHGAWSSGRGFEYIEQNLDYKTIDEVVTFKYDCNTESLDSIVQRAKKTLQTLRKDTVIVGHSLGGVIALALHDERHCHRIVTLAAPIAGINVSPLLESFVYIRAPVLQMISKGSYFIRDLKEKEYTKMIHSFVTTRGFNPFIFEHSDGVISVKAQDGWMPQSAYTTYIDCNHFEILQEKEVSYIINWYTK